MLSRCCQDVVEMLCRCCLAWLGGCKISTRKHASTTTENKKRASARNRACATSMATTYTTSRPLMLSPSAGVQILGQFGFVRGRLLLAPRFAQEARGGCSVGCAGGGSWGVGWEWWSGLSLSTEGQISPCQEHGWETFRHIGIRDV